MENKYCPNCGALTNNAKCEHCGTLISGAKAPITSSGNAGQSENLSLWGYYVKCLKNYAKFKGRARRKEYLGFFLFSCIIAFALIVCGGAIGGITGDEEGTLGTVLFYLYCLAVFVPMLALLVRRLHDTGDNVLLIIGYFIPPISIAVGLYCLFKKGVTGSNKHGDDPLSKEN